MPTTAVRAVPVEVPSHQEIEARFHALLPELRSRALAIAAASRGDPDEVLAEVIGFAWYDHRQSALKGRWLTGSQLAWYGRLRVREGHSLGSRRSKSDILSLACQRKGRAKIVSLSTMDERRADDPCRQQFDRLIGENQPSIPAEVAARIDWSSLRHQLPGRLRRILDGLIAGEGTGQIARSLGVSAARVCQQKDQLRAAVAGFFGNALPVYL